MDAHDNKSPLDVDAKALLAEIAELRAKNRELEHTQLELARVRNSHTDLEQTIERSHRIARLLFWECDGDRLTWCGTQKAIADFLGVAPECLPANDVGFLHLIHPEDREAVEAIYECGSRLAKDFNLEYRLILPDGTKRYVQEIGVARLGADGLHYGHSGTVQDITQRKLAEKEREALIDELGARNAELEQFTYTVSHDLKAPLITIRGFAGLLKQDLLAGDTDKAFEDMSRIDEATGAMRQILDDLLKLSRVGRFVNPGSETPLFDLVQEVRKAISGSLQDTTIKLPESLPTVYGDKARLAELLQNLLENAAKFMGDQPRPLIEIGAEESADAVTCFVRDNGSGIEDRFQEKVFGLFQTLGTQASGSGVGLALAKRIVEFHGGQIWIESEGFGRGSTFRFTLPRRRVA